MTEPIPVFLNSLLPTEVIYIVQGMIALLLVQMVLRVINRYRKSSTTRSFVEDHLSPSEVPPAIPEKVGTSAAPEKTPAKIVGHYIDDFF